MSIQVTPSGPPILIEVGGVVDIDIDITSVGVPGPASPPNQGQIDLQAHVDDTTPHPAYDDLQSLTLIFENGLV